MGVNLWNFSCRLVRVITQMQILGGNVYLLKIWQGKNVQNLVRFTTTITFDFDREYLWTG